MRARLKWLVTFSAKLEAHGPFFDFIATASDTAKSRPFLSRKGEFGVQHASNPARQGHAKLMLSRLPGLRLLGVDLGHRFAAACTVWEALAPAVFMDEIKDRAVLAGGTSDANLYLHTRHRDARSGKERTTIYRRLASDVLADGSVHPAPWARLDRQLLIKLQGEDRPPRKCSPSEREFVARCESEMGRSRSTDDRLPDPVDQLMAEAVRVARLGLRRHGDMAKIAYAFSPAAVRFTPGGGQELLTVESRAELILDALLRWGDMLQNARWESDWARAMWNDHIGCDLDQVGEDPSRQERQAYRAENEKRLRAVAVRFAASDTTALFRLWNEHWTARDAAWRPRLRQLRDWLLPRGLRAKRGESETTATERAMRRNAARRVGGLSLGRIATIRELYQLQKSFAMRPTPEDLRRHTLAKGDDRFEGFGQAVLSTMERLREQRVKQIASRIVEAALGVGRLPHSISQGHDRARPSVRMDAPCHAIVIENLRNYRPDELQTRRENRALMQWSAGKVRKYLEEGCQLHGLLLREVTPNYTSRQSSRTGMPGLRCSDLSIERTSGRPRVQWWQRAVQIASRKVDDGAGSKYDEMLVAIEGMLDTAQRAGLVAPATVRVPRSGGDLFVAARPWGEFRALDSASMGAIQADLNAAANIGLRALLDPDFAGRWWYVPCSSANGQPEPKHCTGAACL
ncbi:MAG: type V CRISPR-associated protein Cas12b, partial [Limnohabitans sp.]|nr:type V CRISPR-associated protein Cas12b [Limnohabitans sp.]